MSGTMNKCLNGPDEEKSLYFIPTVSSVSEFAEKRSRFIGHVWHVKSEEEARERIGQTRAKYHDARHNCWCYLIREGGVARYSDDGEPQGTAGQPMLEVFRRARTEDVCCVVTRYFGGILLGTGGLARAYARAAANALSAAGLSAVRRLTEVAVSCPYGLFERVKLEIEAAEGKAGEIEYHTEVCIHALLPPDRIGPFSARITELTAGASVPLVLGEVLKASPCTEKMNKL